MMEPLVAGVLGTGLALFLVAMGVSVGLSLATGGFIGLILLFGDLGRPVLVLAQTPFTMASMYAFIITPLFILMGVLALHAGLGESAYTAASKLVGNLPGGLAISTIFGCAGFGAACGSSAVTAAIFTKVSLPEMLKYKYQPRLACGAIAAGGTLGSLIPPSTFAIIYGILTELPIGKLLLGGVGPGVLLAVIFSLGVALMVLHNPSLAARADFRISWLDRIKAVLGFWPIALLGTIVLGGIYTGVFTPNEAAATGAVAALILFAFSKKRSWRNLWDALLEAGQTTAMIFLILIGAMVYSRLLVISGISLLFVNTVIGLDLPPLGTLGCFLFMYLVLGCFLDATSMMVITIPLIYPLTVSLGFHPIWFALVAITVMEMGLLTPPLGLNVYVVKAAAGDVASLDDIVRGCFSVLILMGIGVVILIFVPQIITWLPDNMMALRGG